MSSDKMFHIKHGDREYVVMTKKLFNAIMLSEDPTKRLKFLKELGSKTIVANDPLYAVLMKMVNAYEREEVSVGG